MAPEISSQADASDIGYKRPPQHTRFKKGQSGNPSGKKKSKLMRSDYDKLDLSETITVSSQGKRVTMTMRKALHQKLFAMALKENLRAIELLFKLDAVTIHQNGQTDGSEPEVSQSEEALIARFLQRHAGGLDDAGGRDE
jgi:hypothetical protein